jgi:hypothetical protein
MIKDVIMRKIDRAGDVAGCATRADQDIARMRIARTQSAPAVKAIHHQELAAFR